MKIALTTDMYISIIAYSLYNKYLFNETEALIYLEDIGISNTDAIEIQQDNTYGWQSFESTKIWVQAYFDYQQTSNFDNGAFDILRNYFQLPQLQMLLITNGTISDKIGDILYDMKTRYGTNDPIELGLLQWSNSTISLNLPLDLGQLPNISHTLPFPSYMSINKTLSFIPEIFWLLQALKLPMQDYSPYSSSLLEIEYTYPNKNYGSLINIENLAFFFGYLSKNITPPVQQR